MENEFGDGSVQDMGQNNMNYEHQFQLDNLDNSQQKNMDNSNLEFEDHNFELDNQSNNNNYYNDNSQYYTSNNNN